jgi:UDP-GlcNAc:undecaprenyl-phosphate GlcNAc-1-phosphate transferase
MLIGVASGALLTLGALILLRKSAGSLGLLDRPGGHKAHSEAVPAVGGIAICFGFFISAGISPSLETPTSVISLALIVILMLGIVDDLISIPPFLRLTIQLIVVATVIWLDAISPVTLGQPFGTESTVIDNPLIALGLGVILVTGMINAFNMVDGADGLAGSLALLSLAAIAAVAFFSGDSSLFLLSIFLLASIAVFLVFNLPIGFNQKLRLFMGDAGSMMIGLFVGWALLRLSQDPSTVVSPVTLLWFVAMPIFDMLSVILGRVLRGLSPFAPDNSHFHHMLIRRGAGVGVAVTVIVSMALLWGLVGFALHSVIEAPDYLSLLTFLIAWGVTFLLMRGRQA